MTRGFTFIEVLLALLIMALLTGVVATSLVTAMRAEQQAQWVQELRLLARRMSVNDLIDHDLQEISDRAAEKWEIRAEQQQMGKDDTLREWLNWQIVSRERPSIATVVSMISEKP